MYDLTLEVINGGAHRATRLQQGKLRTYLVIMLASMVALVVGFGGLALPLDLSALTWPSYDFSGELAGLRMFALWVTVGAAAASVLLSQDFSAILAFGGCGMGIAILMVLEVAPDVALVQIVVDILTVVILVLALTRLPRVQRRKAQDVTFLKSPASLLRDALIAVSGGVIVMLITLTALLSRPRESIVTAFYEANAKAMTGSKSIVGAIIVDFRGLDTLIEIGVFSMAGLGIYTLLRYAARKFGDTVCEVDSLPVPDANRLATLGIGGPKTSPLIRALAYVSLPVAMVIAATNIMYGHNQPGDGFTAGVIISLAVGFWYVVFGYDETQRRLYWLKASPFIAAGILLAILSGVAAALIKGSFFSNVDLGRMLGLSLPKGFHLSTSFLFELAICLSVLGSVAHMLNALGRPGERDTESARCISEIAEQEINDGVA